MPCLENWNPGKAIMIWLNAKNRRTHSQLMEKQTARKHPYFNGTFSLASSTDENSFDENDVIFDKNVKS